jgi:hypothetical protein
VLRTKGFSAHTGRRPDHTRWSFEGVLTVILPSHQLPSIDFTSKTVCYRLTSPQVKRFATHSRESNRRDILADETSSLLSTDTYVTSITDLKGNVDGQSVYTDTSADTITINEKAPPRSSSRVSGLASYLSSQRRPQTQMNEVPRFGRRKAFFG